MDWQLVEPFIQFAVAILFVFSVAYFLGRQAGRTDEAIQAAKFIDRQREMYRRESGDLQERISCLIKRLEQQTKRYERDLSRYRRIIYEEKRKNGTLGKTRKASLGTPPEQVRGEDEPQTPEGGN